MKLAMPSSVVNQYVYFPETEILQIIYQSGSVYHYFRVPVEIYEKFRQARSKGQFLNMVIKPGFRYKKIY